MKIVNGFIESIESLIIVSLVCVFLTSEAIGADWKLFFENQQQMKFYIDTQSIISLPNDNIRAWKRIVNKDGKGNDELFEVDCKERKYTFRAMKPYNDDDIGKLEVYDAIMNRWTKPVQEWEYFEPSDLDEAIFKTWCSSHNSTMGK
jgi:hypothetical protein